MSRIGKQPVNIPKDIRIRIEDGRVWAESSKHKMDIFIPKGIRVEVKEDKLVISRDNDLKPLKSLHGTIRVLLNNMITGMLEGFKKELEIVGVGYKAQMKGNTLVLNIGFSHPVEMPVPKELKVSTPAPTKIIVEGIDKQIVGEFAARIRRIYPPEPYKGKGIRYLNEEVRKKLGKALAK